MIITPTPVPKISHYNILTNPEKIIKQTPITKQKSNNKQNKLNRTKASM